MFQVSSFKFQEKGFSIIEIIVAIGIVSITTISIIFLFNYSLMRAIENRNKLTAVYLAQEQIEVIRQIRNSNWAKDGVDWDDSISSGDIIVILDNESDINNGWKISRVEEGNSWRKIVYYNTIADGDFYAQFKNGSGSIPAYWEPTKFKRWMTVDRDCDDDDSDEDYCLDITANVSYGGAQTVQIKNRLYNWRM